MAPPNLKFQGVHAENLGGVLQITDVQSQMFAFRLIVAVLVVNTLDNERRKYNFIFYKTSDLQTDQKFVSKKKFIFNK